MNLQKLLQLPVCACSAAGQGTQSVDASCASRRNASDKSSRCQGGFTLTEVLATLIIVGLVSMMMAGGILLASKQFASSMAHSQAQQLYTTLAQTLDSDLRYVGNTSHDYGEEEDEEWGKSVHFHSDTHGNEEIPIDDYLYLRTLDSDGNVQPMGKYGQLALCTKDEEVKNRLLGRGAYNNGLVVKVDSLTYDGDLDCFVIRMSVAQSSDTANPIIDNKEFTVRALNYSGGSDAAAFDG